MHETANIDSSLDSILEDNDSENNTYVLEGEVYPVENNPPMTTPEALFIPFVEALKLIRFGAKTFYNSLTVTKNEDRLPLQTPYGKLGRYERFKAWVGWN